MCEKDTNVECPCCYCTEKRHKVKCLLKPTSPKFNTSTRSNSNPYAEPDQVLLKNDPDKSNPYKVTYVNRNDPYEFKYTINRNEQVSVEDGIIPTSKMVSESELEMYNTAKRHVINTKMKYKPNDTIWVVTNHTSIDNEIFYDLYYNDNPDLKTRICEKDLEPYQEPKEEERPKLNIGIDFPVKKEEKNVCNHFVCNIFRKIGKFLS